MYSAAHNAHEILLVEHSLLNLSFSDFIKVDIFVLKVGTEDLKMDANSCSTHMERGQNSFADFLGTRKS